MEDFEHVTPEEKAIKEIERVVEAINRRAGFPQGAKKYEISEDGKHTAKPGFFHLLSDYGGISLVRVINFNGGVRAVMGGYHKPEVALEMINGFIKGWDERENSVSDYQRMADEHGKEDEHTKMAQASQ
jgi:hypothetical protein